MNLDDTIVAIATPPGRGGIGVVRLAGPEAKAIAMPMLRLKHDLEPGRAVFGELIEPCGAEPVLSDRPTGASRMDNPVREKALDASPGSNKPSGRTGMSDPHRQRIDEVVVTYFGKPHSYTTDDIIEISAHGS